MFWGLIRLEVTVEQGNIGATTPILASPLKGNKPKLLDQAQAVMRRKHYLNGGKSLARVAVRRLCLPFSPAQTPSFLVRGVISALSSLRSRPFRSRTPKRKAERAAAGAQVITR
jgi:hypothetical protein